VYTRSYCICGEQSEELTAEDKFRRKNLEMAVEGDDWSGVIDAQTSETVTKKPLDEAVETAGSVTAAKQPVTTPEGLLNAGAAVSDCKGLELTVENVDQVWYYYPCMCIQNCVSLTYKASQKVLKSKRESMVSLSVA
jgi:hypothetical protein